MEPSPERSLEGLSVAITGGTGSLGRTLVRRILGGELGRPRRVIVLSRDEAKQHQMRLAYQHRRAATDEIIYRTARETLEFRIGDVRDYSAVCVGLRDADVVFNAAALKQVPTCEYFPFEAVLTNVMGPENVVRGVREGRLPASLVIGISTDKACKPVNVMGMTKAIQERIFLSANVVSPSVTFLCVRYGNVLASRGSVIPLFLEQVRQGGPVSITLPEMTRFLVTLDQAADTVFAALRHGHPGETFVPRVPSARILDIAKVLINGRPITIEVKGARPGEKIHEVLVSEEEAGRTVERDGYYVIRPILPELRCDDDQKLGPLREYSSGDDVLDIERLREVLVTAGFIEAGAAALGTDRGGSWD